MKIKDILCFIGIDLLNVGIKIAYPVLGNLSDSLKDKLENAKYIDFSSKNATICSEITNAPLYIYTGYEIGSRLDPNGGAFIGSFLGTFYWMAESLFRNHIIFGDANPASLPGKIISAPIDYVLSLYDRVEEHLENNP